MRPVHLRMARAALNWTLKELEGRASVNKNTISKYEAGGSIMSDALERIEQVFRTAGVRLIEEDDEYGPGVRVTPEHHLQPNQKISLRARNTKSTKRSQK